MRLEYKVALRRVWYFFLIFRLLRCIFFGCVFYIMYGLLGGTASKTSTAIVNYDQGRESVIIKPVLQINNSNASVINIVGSEAIMIDANVMSFSDIEVISSTLVGEAEKGYIDFKTNEIVMLARPKFKIYRF